MKSKSRPITIDGTSYRWSVLPNKGFNLFNARKNEGNGRTISVYFKTDIDSFWLEFPYTDQLNLKVLTPKDAAAIIRQALQDGWNPDEKGHPIVYDLVEEKIIRR